MLNKCCFIGNLGKDPEVRSTQGGREIASLSLGVSERWKDKETGERKERTEWVRVVIFSEGLVKVAKGYLKKGSKLYVEGQMQTRKWTDQSGQERYSTEIVLQGFDAKLVMLDGAKEGGERSDTSGAASRPEPQAAAILDDEIPFAWLIAFALSGVALITKAAILVA